MKRERSDHAAFDLKNKLYIVGGMNRCRKLIDSSEVFDVEKRTWSGGPKLPYALSDPTAETKPILPMFFI